MAEHRLRGPGKPVDQPGFAVIIVHRKRAVGFERAADRLDRFLGKEEGFEADLRCAAHQRERIGQREKDEIVFALGVLEEGAAVVDMPLDAWIGVGAVDVHLDPDLHDARVDIHGIDMLGPFAQRDRNVRTRPCADDQHVVELTRKP